MKKFLLILLFLLCLPTFAQYGPQSVKPMLGQQINWGNPLTKGLVGYWLMNEGGGSKIYDFNENRKNIGTITNAIWVPGKFGSCLNFDGTGDYVSISGPTVPGGNAPFTFLAWIYPSSNTAISDSIIWDLTDQNLLRISESGTTQAQVVFNAFTTNDRVSSGTGTITLNAWNQVVGLYDGSQMKIYTNGLFRAAVTPTGTYAASTMSRIGTRGATNDFDGKIDSVMCFNRALSASEIAELYREPFAMFYDTDIWWLYSAPVTGEGQIIFVQ